MQSLNPAQNYISRTRVFAPILYLIPKLGKIVSEFYDVQWIWRLEIAFEIGCFFYYILQITILFMLHVSNS